MDSPASARIVVWSQGRLVDADGVETLKSLLAADGSARAWIDLVRPDPAELAAISEALGLHPLIVEDIEGTN